MSRWILYSDRRETGQPDTAEQERIARRAAALRRRAERRESRRVTRKRWWRRWGEDVIGWLVFLTLFGVLGGGVAWAAVTDQKADRAWDRECIARGGQVTKKDWVPPDQRTEDAYTYCMIGGRAVGTR